MVAMVEDIRKVLADWPYVPGELTVRKIIGDDGREKIQMRLDLGMLQMEMTNRPDGQRPHGCESLLHYHLDQLDQYRRRNGTDLGFEFTSEQCQALRAEAVMFYHRYLSLFVLEEYDLVERDTARNLQGLDLMHQYAADRTDKLAFQHYRPYIVMMNTRAKAQRALRAKAYRSALAHVDAGLRAVREFLESYGQEESFEDCPEAAILLTVRQEILEQMPADPITKLQKELDSAVREQRYEDAARLRDQIKHLQQRRSDPA
jgi:hypothetical protein